MRALAYEKQIPPEQIRGWRILSKTSLDEQEIAHIIKEYGSIGKTIHSNASVFNPILGEEKAKLFKEQIEKIKRNF